MFHGDNIFFTIFTIIVIIFIYSYLYYLKKMKAIKPKDSEPDKFKPEIKIVPETIFCPYCNTKLEVNSSFKCLRCKKGVICPHCRKCTNFDQHHGI